MPEPLSAILVDPSIYTGPYDAALTEGLIANGVSVVWAARRARSGEDIQLPPHLVEPIFGGHQGGAKGRRLLFKVSRGGSHLMGSRRLLSMVERTRPDVLHVQWPIFPVVDASVMRQARRVAPVVLTLHDLTPYNGAPASRLQLLGFDSVLHAADRVIVHTPGAREALLAKGLAPHRLAVVPHGPLRLKVPLPPRAPGPRPWTVVLFGKVQSYKGLDVLVEAAGLLDEPTRARLRLVVAGEPLMPLQRLLERVKELGLSQVFDFRLHRCSEPEMAALFSEADAFVFPYRRIEASGVFSMVRGLGKWIVATDLGAFQDLRAAEGALTQPEDPKALARALVESIGRVPMEKGEPGADWKDIGRMTREVYLDAMAERGRTRGLV